MADLAADAPVVVSSARRPARSWFDLLLDTADRAPGPPGLAFVGVAILAIVALHVAEFIENGDVSVHPDLVIGGTSIVLPVWFAMALDRVARRSLERLRPALDPAGTPEARIAADLTRTPQALAVPALVLGVIAGAASVIQSPGNWGVDLDHLGPRLVAALVLSVVTDVLLFGMLAHIVHQLRVVTRVHREVQIDLFGLEPLYAFSTLTARTALGLLAILAGLIVTLSLATGTLILTGPADLVVTAGVMAVAASCFFLPLLGLHGRIADARAARFGEAQGTLATVLAAVHGRVAHGDLEGAAKLKDAVLAAESSVAAIARVPTWPWRAETLRGFISAVLLPIGLFVTYELLRRALS